MSRIDRRRALTLLAGGSAMAGVSHAISREAFTAPESEALRERAERQYYWVLARPLNRWSFNAPCWR